MAVNVVYLKYNEDVQEFEHPLRREDKEMIESSFGITLKRILEGTTVKAIDRLEKGKTYTVEGIISPLFADKLSNRPFDPQAYEEKRYSFPSLDKNDHRRPLYGRQDQLRVIEESVSSPHEKWEPIVISTSRGMGKTTLLKVASMTCPTLQASSRVGRLISFDCSQISKIQLKLDDLREAWWGILVVHHICRLFAGCSYKTHLIEQYSIERVVEILTSLSRTPLEHIFYSAIRSGQPFEFLVEVTNYFFGVNDPSKPLVLLDNIQYLGDISCAKSQADIERVTAAKSQPSSDPDESTSMEVESSQEPAKLTTLLSRIFIDAALLSTPIYCLAAGTSDGSLKQQAEGSNFKPKFINLPILAIQDAWRIGEDLLKEMQSKPDSRADNVVLPQFVDQVEDESTPEQVVTLLMLYEACQIPRLTVLAWRTIIDYKIRGAPIGKETASIWEQKVRDYYPESPKIFEKLSPEDSALLVLACSVYFRWPDSMGTGLNYKNLLDESLIFPYDTIQRVCLLPPILLPREMQKIDAKIEELVPGVRRSDLRLSVQEYIFGEGNIKSGGGDPWENYIVCSLAVRGFLAKRIQNQSQFQMSDVYDLNDQHIGECFKRIGAVSFCKVKRMQREVYVTENLDPEFIYINEKTNDAHHDGVIFAANPDSCNGAIQAKYSLSDPAAGGILKQLHKKSVLLWFYLGALEADEESNSRSKVVREAMRNHRLAFLDGSGCISSLTVDVLLFLKQFNQFVHAAREVCHDPEHFPIITEGFLDASPMICNFNPMRWSSMHQIVSRPHFPRSSYR